MLSLIIVPILICGIVWIKSHPLESLKISTYQGWIVYLYAARYGFTAILLSWLFLDCLIPYIFSIYSGFFEIASSSIGLPFPLDGDYLNNMALYVINSTPLEVPEDKLFSAFVTARIAIISLGSVILTKVVCYLYRVLYHKMKWYEKKILSVYEHNSPTDYHLALISARIVENARNKEALASHPRRVIEFNRSLKNGYRVMSRLNSYIARWQGEEYREINRDIIKRDFVKLLYKQRAKSRKLRESISSSPLLAQITLESRKVYIGAPKRIGRPDENGIGNDEIVIFPWYSGYRTESGLNIKLTNKYTPLLMAGQSDIDHVVVHKSNVVTISAFSMEFYEEIENNMKTDINNLLVQFEHP